MDDGIGFEMVAAALRADAGDIQAFLPALAVKLSGALPNCTSVHYHGGMFSKKKTVESIEVDLGEERFRIEDKGGRLEASRQKSVRGIVLKNEPVHVDEWISELSERIADAAASSETSTLALKQMLENG